MTWSRCSRPAKLTPSPIDGYFGAVYYVGPIFSAFRGTPGGSGLLPGAARGSGGAGSGRARPRHAGRTAQRAEATAWWSKGRPTGRTSAISGRCSPTRGRWWSPRPTPRSAEPTTSASATIPTDPLGTLADYCSGCYTNLNLPARIDMLVRYIQEYQADGFLINSVKSCNSFSAGQLMILREVEKRTGIPGGFIESDLVDPRYFSAANIKNRLESYFQMIDARRAGEIGMSYVVGIDLGSTTTKALVLDGDQQMHRAAGSPTPGRTTIWRRRWPGPRRSSTRGSTMVNRHAEQVGAAERGGATAAGLRAGAAAAPAAPAGGADAGGSGDLDRPPSSVGAVRRGDPEICRRITRGGGGRASGSRRCCGPTSSATLWDRRSCASPRRSASPAESAIDRLVGVYDKCIIRVENEPLDLDFRDHIGEALKRIGEPPGLADAVECRGGRGPDPGRPPWEPDTAGPGCRSRRSRSGPRSCATGWERTRCSRKPAPCSTSAGQDTKAIQIDSAGIVTSFQMNDRCAAGCGRYLGYIADEMNLGLHELGPLAEQSRRCVKINSTCTVFAGAELRERLSLGEKREDILAGLHRAIVLRAMSLLARSGGVADEFTFTGGVAKNPAAVRALRELVRGELRRPACSTSLPTASTPARWAPRSSPAGWWLMYHRPPGSTSGAAP